VTNSTGLEDKAVIVTGSAQGIGFNVARHLCASGARVLLADIDAEELDRAASSLHEFGSRAEVAVCDVTNASDVARMAEDCIRSFGAIDGLVNNAAVYYLDLPWQYDPDAARRLIEVNVLGVMTCTAAVLPQMRAGRAGSIVNVTSGAFMGLPDMSVYGASKGAVASFTYCAAIDLARTGIRINAVSPLGATRMGKTSANYFTAAGRPGRLHPLPDPSNNAPLISYLLSDRSIGIHGQIVRIVGSKLCLVSHPDAIAESAVEADQWDLDAVDAAFRSRLCAHVQPIEVSH
jgi:NAD(P)-dependent dehydrogenase (short-subunit alcohol dehydrogenase family)